MIRFCIALLIICGTAQAQSVFEMPVAVDAEPKIILETIPACTACDTWLQASAVDLLRNGWTLKVEKLNAPVSGRLYPRWRVCVNGACFQVDNTPNFNARLRLILERIR